MTTTPPPMTAYVLCVIFGRTMYLDSVPHRRCLFPTEIHGSLDIWTPADHVMELGAYCADGILDLVGLKAMSGCSLSDVKLVPIAMIEVEVLSIDKATGRATVRLPGYGTLAVFPMDHVFQYDLKAAYKATLETVCS